MQRSPSCSRHRSDHRRTVSAALFAAACTLTTAVGPTAAQRPAAPRDSSPLPRLDEGVVIGTTRYGSGDLPPDIDPVTQRLDEAVAAGLRGFTVYADWPALEPGPGDYTFGPLLAELDRLHARGMKTFVNITVGDIGEYVVPEVYTDGSGGLAPGVRLDDPALLARFRGLLVALAPELVDRGVFALGVGNEIDDRLDGEHADEREPYARFVRAANDHLDAVAPGLATGVTLTATAHRAGSETLAAMRSAGDFVAVNYAPIAPDFFVLEPGEIASDFSAVLATFGTGPIVIQELTCPSAASMGASDQWQASCFEILFDVGLADPRVRFASVFSLEDFAEPVCSEIRAAFPPLDGVPEDFERRFQDYLCALGVLDGQGRPKPAWSVLLEAAGDAVPGRLERLRGRASPPESRADLLRPASDPSRRPR